MAQKTNKLDQSLIEFVTKLQEKNDIDIAIPQVDIDQVLENPEQYGYDFIENIFTQYVKVFTEAHKLGDEFGKRVMENA
ncbi:MAG: hypothetical protein Unbinned4234contig1003_5 [Prokaryotic dsDNA virus sp.]|nr:MAG: hypothetical protein Unbinned4234contig1003_5 [Prokaryotic dsDNA virus sp.]